MSVYVPAALRRLVESRASERCEYCLSPSEDAFFPHEPDHIIACKHGGATIESNLAFACFLCNRFKGTDIASVDPDTGAVVPLFHPRHHDWNDHFRMENGAIVPLTPQGRATVRLLQLNRAESLETRRYLSSIGRWPP